ncbi:hypothetical protein EXU48_19515 [Occultella glacieicola]|uniref:Cell wall-binding repeat-containing protein n=1 Tax=Occultella glacieicola TaxID=2518684 RepID=A0ABY2DYR1_9MICO|nr:hypothetical protein [Occultella glacieicola]TDE89626.1 hypothetical protein EXU48_19515 [Occultella glacieicola]
MRHRSRAWWAAVAAALLLLAGCDGNVNLDPDPSSPTTSQAPRPAGVPQPPTEPTTLFASSEASELAMMASQAFFESAQVAVVAPAADVSASARAASIGSALGVPVLLTGVDDIGVEQEWVRLGVGAVVTVGGVVLESFDITGLTIAPAPADVGDLGELLGLDLTEAEAAPAGGEVAALAALPTDQVLPEGSADAEPDPSESPAGTDPAGTDPADASSAGTDPAGTDPAGTDPAASDPAASDPASTDPADAGSDGAATPTADGSPADAPEDTGTTAAGEGSDPDPSDPVDPGETPEAVGEMPELEATERLEGVLALADGDPVQAAAVGTVRAAGGTVLVIAGDPRASSEAMAALASATSVVGIGTTYGDLTQFAWQSETAATGTQLPGGGQLVFDGKRYVALYGSPHTASLGLLGEQDTPATVERAAAVAATYQPLTEDTVVPALEIIVTVASGSAGEDGNYSNEWPAEGFVPMIEAAQAAGQYVVLDFQPGRTSFLEQVQAYESLLRYPNVGIALDPEWRLESDQVHLRQIGHVGIDEVNSVVTYLADFVRENRLPQKLIVLHQFSVSMIEGRENLDTSRAEVALLIHADGQGTQAAKAGTWSALHVNAPAGVHWGWKNFIDEDQPTLTPAQTYAVTPMPDFVSYQ